METIIIIVLSILLVASLVGNAILGWYARKVIGTLTLAGQVSIEFFARLNNYTRHLESVYQLQVFHGDRTIRSLIKHTKEISEYLKAHTEITSFTQPDLLEALEEIERQEEIKREQDGYDNNEEKEAS